MVYVLDSGVCIPAGVSVKRRDFTGIGFNQARVAALMKEELNMAGDQVSAVSSSQNILSLLNKVQYKKKVTVQVIFFLKNHETSFGVYEKRT